MEFETEGTSFSFSRLPVKKSLEGLGLVTALIAPVAAGAVAAREGSLGDVRGNLAQGMDSLPKMLDLFAPYVKFKREGIGNGGWMELGPLVEEALPSPLATLELLTRCVLTEYGGFLAVRDWSARLPPELAAFVSPAGSTPPSGE